MTRRVRHAALRRAAKAAAMLCVALTTPAVAAIYVPLTEVTHEYDQSLPHFDQSLQMALIEEGWLPLVVTANEITAETTSRDHYAKVRIRFGDGKATFTLIDSKNLDNGECVYRKEGKMFRGRCVHGAYYEWLKLVMRTIPLGHARIEFVRSLAQ